MMLNRIDGAVLDDNMVCKSLVVFVGLENI